MKFLQDSGTPSLIALGLIPPPPRGDAENKLDFELVLQSNNNINIVAKKVDWYQNLYHSHWYFPIYTKMLPKVNKIEAVPPCGVRMFRFFFTQLCHLFNHVIISLHYQFNRRQILFAERAKTSHNFTLNLEYPCFFYYRMAFRITPIG